MSVREDLIAAKALIDTPKKWVKGEYQSDTGSAFCILGACDEAQISRAAEAVLRNQVPSHYNWMIVSFNDAATTTHADVLALFDRAIEAASP